MQVQSFTLAAGKTVRVSNSDTTRTYVVRHAESGLRVRFNVLAGHSFEISGDSGIGGTITIEIRGDLENDLVGLVP